MTTLWSPDKLERQMACFERNPALDLVFGHIQNFFTPEMPPEERERLAVPLRPLPGLLQGAMLARRRSFDRVGLFSEERSVGDFLDWYGRAMLAADEHRNAARKRWSTGAFMRTTINARTNTSAGSIFAP